MSTALETRERLLRQGRIAFAEKGHDGVSLQRDVLIPAGVSNGSFYHQFSDKTDLLVAILRAGAENAQQQRAEFLAAESSDTVEHKSVEHRARRRIEFWLQLVEGGEDLFRIQLRERNNPDKRVRKLVSEVRVLSSTALEEGLRPNAGLLSQLDDPELAMQLIRALTTGVLMDYLDTPKRRRVAEQEALADRMATFIAGGLRALAEQPNRTKVVAS